MKPLVALRKESVDRNKCAICSIKVCIESLSARRAWIEIKYVVKDSDFSGSLSARRAWIEMWGNIRGKCVYCVALRKESVDRNPTALRKSYAV